MLNWQQLPLALGILALFTTPAEAHRLLVDGRVDGGRLRVEAFYEDDTPAPQAAITVEDANATVIASGMTDDKGNWSCLLPAPGAYVIKAQSTGHAAAKKLIIGEANAESTHMASKPGSASSTDDSSTMGTPRSRADLTGTPWLKVGIGFAVIAVLFTIAWMARRGLTADKEASAE